MSCVSVKLWYTQTHLSGFILFGPSGCQRTKSGADLDLYYKDRALMTWNLVKGQKGHVEGLRASGQQGSDPYLYIQGSGILNTAGLTNLLSP
jgi:hypothetical protein